MLWRKHSSSIYSASTGGVGVEKITFKTMASCMAVVAAIGLSIAPLGLRAVFIRALTVFKILMVFQ